MNHLVRTALVVTCLALPALAQDSTSIPPFGSAIGDAVYPWDTGEQINTFLVDTQPITSTLGYPFRIAPLIKSSKMNDVYLNELIGAQALSNTLREDVGFPRPQYMFWDQPGYGVNNNPGLNTPGIQVATSGFTGCQFAIGFGETGDSDTVEDVSSVVGAVVNYQAGEPGRLYVARIAAAIDGNGTTPAPSGGNSGSFHLGSIDAHGNVHFRADDFLSAGADPLDGNNYVRIDTLARNFSMRNEVDLLGGDDAAATTMVLEADPTWHSTPNIIPEQLAGRPVLMGVNFDVEYVYESSAGATSTTLSHVATGVAATRGTVAFTHRFTSVADSMGTAGVLAKVVDRTIGANLWDVGNNGQVLNRYLLVAPEVWDLGGGQIFGDAAFGHYFSQTQYHGGNAPLALGADAAGNALAAGTMLQYAADFSYLDNPYNLIAVSRFTPGEPDGAEWTPVAWVVNTDLLDQAAYDGTPIFDPAGTPIGRLAPLFRVTGADPTDPLETRVLGPSLTTPAFDGLGNLYFLAPVEFFGDPDPWFTSCLLRAVYDADTFSYRLEVILRKAILDYDAGGAVLFGDVLHGQNSDTDYVISFLGIADGDSISSGTSWSHNTIQPANALRRATPGGVVVSASITYDYNGDGLFDGTVCFDEQYNVILYLVPPACIRGDANCDGVINAFDIDAFVTALSDQPTWETTYTCDYLCANDVTGDAAVNAFDIDAFVALLSGR